ncbi:MAG: oxaloacetate decarboxylase [Nitrososphaerales archaeon]
MRASSILRQMLKEAGIIVAPGAFNAFLAKLVEQVGFKAVYVSGAGTSITMLGLPDLGFMTLNEIIWNTRNIARAVNIPVIADANTGYGNAVTLTRTVEEFIKAGAAAIHIEDQEIPKRCGHLKGKILIPIEEMVGKIKAAIDTRDKLDPDFVIIARTDARGAVKGGVDEALKRAEAYIKAGADMIFIEGPKSIDELKLFAERIKAPLMANMVEGGITPLLSTKELEELGYKLVIFPNSILRLIHKAAIELLEELKQTGSTKAFLSKMMLFPSQQDVVGLKEYVKLEEKYLPKEEVRIKYTESLGF